MRFDNWRQLRGGMNCEAADLPKCKLYRNFQPAGLGSTGLKSTTVSCGQNSVCALSELSHGNGEPPDHPSVIALMPGKSLFGAVWRTSE